MKRYAAIFLMIIFTGIVLISCQQEILFDALPSKGSLMDSTGRCSPIIIGGRFLAGKNMNDSNFIQISVNVTSAGNYSIISDTVNGFFFKAGGNFIGPGIYVLKLAASGKPSSAGPVSFTLTYNNSVCVFSINVSTTSGLPATPAVFQLGGAPDTCLPVMLSGSFIKDIALNAQNKVTVALKVTVPGTYNIATNEVNGYKFYGTGVVDTGIQIISLAAIGTPLMGGGDTFKITAGNSICTFSVRISSPVIVNGDDYFPLTNNSYWTYDDLMIPGDTLKRVIADSLIIAGLQYCIMQEAGRYQDTSFMFRKSGNNYIQYGPADILTTALKYTPSVFASINFLKQYLIKGDSWSSAEYVGNLFSGQPVYLQYNFYCIDANASITVNGYSFINVYHIVMLPQLRSSLTLPYNSTNEQVDLYYAKAIGLVYLYGTNNGFRMKELKIRHWKIY